MRAILVVSVLLVLARAGVAHADEPRSPGETNEGAIELCTQQPGSDGCTRWLYYCMLRPSHSVCTALGVAGILATDPDKAQMVVNFFNDMESVNEQSFQDTFYTGCNTYRLNGTSGEEHVDDFCGFYASWCAVNFRPTSRSVKLWSTFTSYS